MGVLQDLLGAQGIPTVNYVEPFSALAPGTCVTATFVWTAPDTGTSINWTAEVEVTGDLVDPNPTNNTATGQTLVYPLRK